MQFYRVKGIRESSKEVEHKKQGRKIWRKIIKEVKVEIFIIFRIPSWLFHLWISSSPLSKITFKLEFLYPKGYMGPLHQYRPPYLHHKACLEIRVEGFNIVF